MAKPEDIRKVINLCIEDKMTEAFSYAYEHDVFMCEDWQTISGSEYYVVAIEDDVLWFRQDAFGDFVLCSGSPEI